MPRVTLRAENVDGKEHALTEYICDWPHCPNVAEHVLGAARELRAAFAVCKMHAELLALRNQD